MTIVTKEMEEEGGWKLYVHARDECETFFPLPLAIFTRHYANGILHRQTDRPPSSIQLCPF